MFWGIIRLGRVFIVSGHAWLPFHMKILIFSDYSYSTSLKIKVLFSVVAHLLSIQHGEKGSDLLGWVQEEKMSGSQMMLELSGPARTQPTPRTINNGGFRGCGPQGLRGEAGSGQVGIHPA